MKIPGSFRARRVGNPSRIRIRRYNAKFARLTEPEMLVLDAGAGRAPYRDLFSHVRYETADIALLDRRYADLTYVCDLTDVPVEDGRFDRVICNQVLEHVPDPRAVLREVARVTKDGGRVLCTCPFFFQPHQKPYDYYRYTSYALRELFADSGFAVDRIDWVEGYFATVGLQFTHMSRFLPKRVARAGRGWKWWLAAPAVGTVRAAAPLLASFFYRLDLAWKYTDRGYPKNYVVWATRQPRGAAHA